MNQGIEEKLYRILEPYEKRVKGSEDRKVYDQFFDRRTLLTLYDLMNDGFIQTLDYPVSTGKEGGVFHGTSEEGKAVAVKIYRISNAVFRSMWRYVEGDERFRNVSKNFTRLIFLWAQREFANLQRYASCGLSVPTPIARKDNVLVMDYIGDENGPAPLLKDVEMENPQKLYLDTVEFMKQSYQKAGLVHGDLSAYNILLHRDRLYVIDCGQAMTKRHPNALEFLARDAKNINHFFHSRGAEVLQHGVLMREITGEGIAISPHST